MPFDAREILKSLSADGPAGNRWLKVNLHVHARGNDPAEIVAAARRAHVDIIAITDHQAFCTYGSVARAAETPGRTLTVLPGIEITSVEGVHLLGIFPQSFDDDAQKGFLGWLEITGSGSTKAASTRAVEDILRKVDSLSGVTIVPHPFTDDIGMFASASKMNMRERWLDSGFVHLVQIAETHRDRIRYVESDGDGNWVNRFVLATASPQQVEASRYCLAPFNRTDACRPDEIAAGCSWFRMSEPSILGLKQIACEPKTRIATEEPPRSSHAVVLGLRVTGGHRTDYLSTLQQLAERVTAGHGRRIRNRDEHLTRIVSSVTPLQLAEALDNNGPLNGQSLAELCGVTENTCEVLCGIADDIRLLNQLQTAETPDVPDIRVRRRGEDVFAEPPDVESGDLRSISLGVAEHGGTDHRIHAGAARDRLGKRVPEVAHEGPDGIPSGNQDRQCASLRLVAVQFQGRA